MAKILVIEDEAAILENIIEVLNLEEDYEVQGARSGAAGLALAESFQPDLILCDIYMPPGLNGHEVLMRLREDARTVFTPFVFLTARSGRADQRQGMNLGADDYLSKPFTPKELLELVQTRLEVKIQREQEYEKRLSELRSNLLHTLPHELRTPLTGILGYSSMILGDFDNLDRNHLLDMVAAIQRSGQRLYRLVENYLLFAQLEVLTSMELKLNPDQQITEVTTIRPTAERKAESHKRQDDLELSISEGALLVTPDDLNKVITELLDNAIKFSTAKTPIVVKGNRVGNQYEFCITNQGRGMSAEEIARIGAYMQFKRRLYEQQGSGLGLVITKRLVELYGGSLVIESELEGETKVCVRLPTA